MKHAWMMLGCLMVALAAGGCGQGGAAGGPVGQPGPGWVAFGDSITEMAFADPQAWRAAFAGSAPPVVDAGHHGDDSADAAAKVDAVLAANPQARYVAIGFGTNDALNGNQPANCQAMLEVVVNRVRAAGKEPLLARIPYGRDPRLASVPAFNQAIDALRASAGLRAGADLYAHFATHPDDLQADGIHPNASGQAAIQRLWATLAGGGR